MKKNFLSAIVFASIATATNATTYMNVEQEGGQVSSFDVEKVIQVTYGDAENTDVCVSSSEVEELKKQYEKKIENLQSTIEELQSNNQFDVILYNNVEYVDLGLESGLMWATANLGAQKPEDFGSFFMWGELDSKGNDKSAYSANNYSLYDATNKKYIKYDAETSKLMLRDDAASANLGGYWRMPTAEDCKELIDACTWQLVDSPNGEYKMAVGTSKANGKTITFPCAGKLISVQGAALYTGSYGLYWTSELDVDSSAWILDLGTHNLSTPSKKPSITRQTRYEGATIRAVCPSK